MIRIFVLLLIVHCSLFFVPYAIASDYVMPYPSYMPGHKLYKPHQVWEIISEYWYFGDLAKEKFHRHLADRYMIEAKTLFDYGQHKLAVDALEKSNDHFAKAVLYLMDIADVKKDNGESKLLLQQSGIEHTKLLNELEEFLPDEIDWKEEKKESQKLPLTFLFAQSKNIRTYANR